VPTVLFPADVAMTPAARQLHSVEDVAVPGQQARVNLPLVVSVRDNGRGVSDEIRSHLFDAFVTNKPTGTGLGLALVAKIINDHGGAIEYDSEPGRTIFRVMLPLQQSPAHP